MSVNVLWSEARVAAFWENWEDMGILRKGGGRVRIVDAIMVPWLYTSQCYIWIQI
jgi:hypothetical protein